MLRGNSNSNKAWGSRGEAQEEEDQQQRKSNIGDNKDNEPAAGQNIRWSSLDFIEIACQGSRCSIRTQQKKSKRRCVVGEGWVKHGSQQNPG